MLQLFCSLGIHAVIHLHYVVQMLCCLVDMLSVASTASEYSVGVSVSSCIVSSPEKEEWLTTGYLFCSFPCVLVSWKTWSVDASTRAWCVAQVHQKLYFILWVRLCCYSFKKCLIVIVVTHGLFCPCATPVWASSWIFLCRSSVSAVSVCISWCLTCVFDSPESSSAVLQFWTSFQPVWWYLLWSSSGQLLFCQECAGLPLC